jgi:hypothetical protein
VDLTVARMFLRLRHDRSRENRSDEQRYDGDSNIASDKPSNRSLEICIKGRWG